MRIIETTGSRRSLADPYIDEALPHMRDVVTALNGARPTSIRNGKRQIVRLPASETQIELKSLVERWNKSGPNLRKMFEDEPELRERARHGKTVLYPGPDGRGYLDWSPLTPESHLSTDKYEFSSPQDRALKSFIALIVNPEWALLAGPCRRCGDYFLKFANRDRAYCSKHCSSASTALPSIKRKRAKDRAVKLELAQKLIGEWTKKRPRGFSWQTWVGRDPQFTKNWLTRAAKSGNLILPG